jgi:hypothetical protein
MKPLPSRSISLVRLSAIAALSGAALSGCYVVPLGQPTPNSPSQQAYAPAPAPGPVTQTFNARLYPSNAEATPYGAITGTVTNDMNGRGHISANIGGEQFQGEATRAQGSRSTGIANAAGNRGSMLNCQYTMNSATLGSGQCVLNNGPAFTMHIGG